MNGQSFQGSVLRVEEARPPPPTRDRSAGLPPPPPGRRAGFRVKVFGIGPHIRWQHLKVRGDAHAAGAGGSLTNAAPLGAMIAGHRPPCGRGYGAPQRPVLRGFSRCLSGARDALAHCVPRQFADVLPDGPEGAPFGEIGFRSLAGAERAVQMLNGTVLLGQRLTTAPVRTPQPSQRATPL